MSNDRRFISNIPLPWVEHLGAESDLPGAFVVAMQLWHTAGLLKKKTVPINLRKLPITRQRAQRGLRDLIKFGLVEEVKAEVGKCKEVKLLDVVREYKGREYKCGKKINEATKNGMERNNHAHK